MLVAHTLPDIQELFDRFADAARRFGLTVSLKKTEVMLQSYSTNQSATATVMASDTILGSYLSNTLNEARDDGVLVWQCHQLDHMQTICTSLQMDNHTNTSPVNF